jgi:GT2 family glycosyltransferase
MALLTMEDKYKTKILIAIPVLNQLEYTKKVFDTIRFPYKFELLIINNGSTDGTDKYCKSLVNRGLILYKNFGKNEGTCKAWNYALNLGFNARKAEQVFILNNDILLLQHTLEHMHFDCRLPDVGLASAKDVSGKCADEKDFFTRAWPECGEKLETPDFSCFVINKECFERVGGFDENIFPAYFEDNDYHYRMKLKGYKAICDYANIYWHYGSRTKQQDKKLEGYLNACYTKNQDYYFLKWGGTPGNEKYKIPFDGEKPPTIEKIYYE